LLLLLDPLEALKDVLLLMLLRGTIWLSSIELMVASL
jgi:hypothetical protein